MKAIELKSPGDVNQLIYIEKDTPNVSVQHVVLASYI
jgi:hypothetical protein